MTVSDWSPALVVALAVNQYIDQSGGNDDPMTVLSRVVQVFHPVLEAQLGTGWLLVGKRLLQCRPVRHQPGT